MTERMMKHYEGDDCPGGHVAAEAYEGQRERAMSGPDLAAQAIAKSLMEAADVVGFNRGVRSAREVVAAHRCCSRDCTRRYYYDADGDACTAYHHKESCRAAILRELEAAGKEEG